MSLLTLKLVAQADGIPHEVPPARQPRVQPLRLPVEGAAQS
jgi:hypothetical protein